MMANNNSSLIPSLSLRLMKNKKEQGYAHKSTKQQLINMLTLN